MLVEPCFLSSNLVKYVEVRWLVAFTIFAALASRFVKLCIVTACIQGTHSIQQNSYHEIDQTINVLLLTVLQSSKKEKKNILPEKEINQLLSGI